MAEACDAETNAFETSGCEVCGEKISRFEIDCELEPPPTLKGLQNSAAPDPALPGFFNPSPGGGGARMVRVRLDSKRADDPPGPCGNAYDGVMWDESDVESPAVITNTAEETLPYPCKNPALPAYAYGAWSHTDGDGDHVDVSLDVDDHWKLALVKIQNHVDDKPGHYTGIQLVGYYDAVAPVNNNWALAGPPPAILEGDPDCACPVTIINLAEVYSTDSTHGLQCDQFMFGVILNRPDDPADERTVAVNMQIDESFWAKISVPHTRYPWAKPSEMTTPWAYTFEEVDFQDNGTQIAVTAPRGGDCYEINNNLMVPDNQIVRIFRCQRPRNTGTVEAPDYACEIIWAFMCDRVVQTDVIVKIQEPHTGGGKYAGIILNAPLADVALAGNLAEADCGDSAAAVECIIVNPSEIGKATHDIADNTVAFGKVVRVNDDVDARPIVVIAGTGAVERFGKVSAYTAGDNEVTLTPCTQAGTATGEADIDAYITMPVTRTKCSIVDISVNDVLIYKALGSLFYLATVPLPISVTEYDVLQVASTSGSTGFDSLKIKA